MSANRKPGEQSMDDILASIRRIIAEEPKPGQAQTAAPADVVVTPPIAPAAPTVVPKSTPAPDAKLTPAQAWGALGATRKPAPPAGLQGAPQSSARPASAATKHETPTIAAQTMTASPMPERPTVPTGSLGDDLADLIGAVRANANLGVGGGAAPTPTPSAAAAAEPPPIAPAASDVTSQNASVPPMPKVAFGVAAPKPTSPGAVSAPTGQVAPAIQKLATSGQPMSHSPTVSAPLVAEARARGIEAALGPSAGPTAAAQVPPAVAKIVSPMPAAPLSESDKPAAPPTFAATGSEKVARSGADVLADAHVTPAPLPSRSLPPSGIEPTPSVLAAKSAVNPATAKTQAVRSMEDTVADMLRPLLRDWLDEHMPTIVEKAMKAELAERERRKTGQKPN